MKANRLHRCPRSSSQSQSPSPHLPLFPYDLDKLSPVAANLSSGHRIALEAPEIGVFGHCVMWKMHGGKRTRCTKFNDTDTSTLINRAAVTKIKDSRTR